MLTPTDVQRLVNRPDPIILDVGCNDGEHTQQFLDLFQRGTVFCFDPDPRARARFKKAIQDRRALLFALALGAVDGSAVFYQSNGLPSEDWAERVPDGWDFSGSLRKPKQHLVSHPWCTFGTKIQVPVARLDTWAAKHGVVAVDFLWADVQGAERDLVAGGTQTLLHTRYFYTEYSNEEMYEGQATLNQLCEQLPGFELVQAWENDALFRNRVLTCN